MMGGRWRFWVGRRGVGRGRVWVALKDSYGVLLNILNILSRLVISIQCILGRVVIRAGKEVGCCVGGRGYVVADVLCCV